MIKKMTQGALILGTISLIDIFVLTLPLWLFVTITVMALALLEASS
ncbi:hypothetical protein [Marinobacter sp. P4B1]|nr:hypothetical protein [Marinobacter sp. P4B1]